MTARRSPPHEDDGASGSPPCPEGLLAEVTKMNTTLQGVATDVSAIIKETTTELKTAVAATQERLSEAETRIVRLEETSERLHADEGETSKQSEAMWDRIQTLKITARALM